MHSPSSFQRRSFWLLIVMLVTFGSVFLPSIKQSPADAAYEMPPYLPLSSAQAVAAPIHCDSGSPKTVCFSGGCSTFCQVDYPRYQTPSSTSSYPAYPGTVAGQSSAIHCDSGFTPQTSCFSGGCSTMCRPAFTYSSVSSVSYPSYPTYPASPTTTGGGSVRCDTGTPVTRCFSGGCTTYCNVSPVSPVYPSYPTYVRDPLYPSYPVSGTSMRCDSGFSPRPACSNGRCSTICQPVATFPYILR